MGAIVPLILHLSAPGSTDYHKLGFSEPKNPSLSALRAEKIVSFLLR